MNDVKMIPVSSSNIDSVGYDETNQVVHVRFLNGTLYLCRRTQIHQNIS